MNYAQREAKYPYMSAIEEIEELKKEIERLRRYHRQYCEQFKLAYDWVDTQFPDGGMADFAKYIGDEEE